MLNVFRVEVEDGGARIGTLRGVAGGEEGIGGVKFVETPCALVVTRRGSLPNMPTQLYDLDEEFQNGMLQVPVLDFALLNPNDGMQGKDVIKKLGVHKFCGLQGRMVVLSFRAAGSQDFLFKVGSNRAFVRGELRGQTQSVKITVDEVIELQRSMQCEFFEPPSVPAYPHSSKKELASSVFRSLTYLDETITRRADTKGGILGVVQGGFNDEWRRMSAMETAKRAKDGNVYGFVLSGLGVGESPTEWERAIETATAELPREFPRFITGNGSPEELLSAIARGVDVFDCSYPFDTAEFGIALDLKNGEVVWSTRSRNMVTSLTLPLQWMCECFYVFVRFVRVGVDERGRGERKGERES